MRKVRVKKLRKEFEESIAYMKPVDRMRGSALYNRLWREFKREYKAK
jgi:hypothetical protein